MPFTSGLTAKPQSVKPKSNSSKNESTPRPPTHTVSSPNTVKPHVVQNGSTQPVPKLLPQPPQGSVPGLDYDKLAYAVSMAETGGCKDGTAIKRNNCFGIMQWDKKGRRSPRYFKTQADSFAEFKRIWKKSYKRFPDKALAAKWTGNDSPETWLNNVKYYYYK